MNDQHDWRELAAGYALGILDADERALFEKHLDAASAREADELAAIAGLLGEAVPALTPPSALRDRVLGEARASRPSGDVVEMPVSAPARGRAAWIPALAAAAALVFVLIFYDGQRREMAGMQAQIDGLGQELELAEQLAEQRRLLVEILLDPDIQVAVLAGPDAPPSMRLYWNGRQRVALVTAFNLDPAATGSTYQLWGIDTASGADPVSLGTFDTTAQRSAIVALNVPAGVTFNVAAVTLEPAGGSPQPTTTPFLVGNLSSN
ncbi:MAG: hypothetical protein GKS06_02775 [Acidobacteria bacterium]|nr:hypothetical protein [Acidobacteriota bacterium]